MQQEFSLRDIYFMVLVHARGMWRHRWYTVFVAWFICISGWGAVSAMEDQYQASGRVQILDPRTAIKNYLDKDIKQADVTAKARQVLNGLFTRQNLLKAIAETDLAFLVNNDHEKEAMIALLRAQLSLRHAGNDVYVIAHRHNLPRITQQVVQALMNLLPLDTVQSITAGQAERAKDILKQQTADYALQMQQAEQNLQEFMAKHLLLFPTSGGDYNNRVRSLSGEVDATRAKLRELEGRRQETQRQLEQIKNSSPSPSGEIDKKIEELQNRLQELLGRHYLKGGEKRPLYTRDHPDVIALSKSIEMLGLRKEEITRKLKADADDPDLWAVEANPVFRQLRLAASELDVELVAVRARLVEMEQQYATLTELRSQVPGIRNEYVRLQSRLEVARGRMQSMLSQEGKADRTSEVEKRWSSFVRFEILEVPSVPTVPTGPDRPLFSTVVLVSGILAGVAVALFLAVIRPVFDSPASLKKVLGLPVLGMVSMVDGGSGRRWRHSGLLFVLGLLGLVGAYATVLTLHPTW